MFFHNTKNFLPVWEEVFCFPGKNMMLQQRSVFAGATEREEKSILAALRPRAPVGRHVGLRTNGQESLTVCPRPSQGNEKEGISFGPGGQLAASSVFFVAV
jgi:hypothetical protein